MEYGAPNSVSKLYSVPRRFDVAAIMAVQLAYALLFVALRLVQIQPIDFVKVAGFFTCVGVGQAVLFRGKRPRLSSVLLGVVYLVGIYVVHAISRDDSMLQLHYLALLVWLVIAIAGAFCGYFAGVAVGTVFLVSAVMRRAIQRRQSSGVSRDSSASRMQHRQMPQETTHV